jgi:hypothetical protein
MKFSSTTDRLVLSTEYTTPGRFAVSDMPRFRGSRRVSKSASVQNAVYAYIRAVRALGRTKIGTAEVAGALSLSTREVNGALSSLKKRGVKALNG